MVQCEIQEDVIMRMVESIINKKMDTIRMMVESCVNKKLKDYRKLANNAYKTHANNVHNVHNNQDADTLRTQSRTQLRCGFQPKLEASSSTFSTQNAFDLASAPVSASGSVNPYTNAPNSPSVSTSAYSSISSSTAAYSAASTHTITPLSNFGTENFQYMYMPYLSDLIKGMSDFKLIFQVVLKDLYFNPDHKENSIVFIPPNAFKTMCVYVDGIWKNYDLDISLQNIIRRVNDVLQYYLVGNREEDKFKTEIGKKKFDQLHAFTNQIDNMEEFPDFLVQLMQQTEHAITTHQYLVHRNLTECDEHTSQI